MWKNLPQESKRYWEKLGAQFGSEKNIIQEVSNKIS